MVTKIKDRMNGNLGYYVWEIGKVILIPAIIFVIVQYALVSKLEAKLEGLCNLVTRIDQGLGGRMDRVETRIGGLESLHMKQISEKVVKEKLSDGPPEWKKATGETK